MSATQLEPDALEQAFSAYDPDELWTLIFAAATSPGNRHRSVTLGSSFAAALRASAAPASDEYQSLPSIQALSDLVATTYGIGPAREDFIPTDPTRTAFLAVGSESLRAVPGLTERPVADLTRALRMAEAVDDRLRRRFRFGIANVVNLAMRYGDLCVRHLADAWVAVPDLELSDEVSLPGAEYEATRDFLNMDPVDHIELDEADKRALEWMTNSAGGAAFDIESPSSPFGRFLRFGDSAGGFRWVPPLFVPEIMAHAVQELISALDRDGHARRALRSSCLNQIRQALWRFSDTLIEAPPSSEGVDSPLRGIDVQWLVPVNPSTCIAVSVIYVPDLGSTPPPRIGSVDLAKQIRSQSDPVSVRMAGGRQGTIKPGTEVIPLTVFAAAGHIAVSQAVGEANLALEDLTWIAGTATSDDDLYAFTRDLSAPDFPESFGWEAINYWEPWKANGKSFFKGGVIPTAVYFEAHAGEAEWDRAVELSDLEVALHRVGLPPIRDLRAAEVAPGPVANVAMIAGDSKYEATRGVATAPGVDGWSLALTEPPVAVARASVEKLSADHRRFIFDLCGGLIYGFASLGDRWRSAHQTNDVPGYVLYLHTSETASDESTSVVTAYLDPVARAVDEPVNVLWRIDVERFADSANGDPHAANLLTVDAVFDLLRAGGMDIEVAAALRDQWRTAKPFLILEMKQSRTTLNHLPDPWRLRPSDESRMIAALGRRLHDAGVEPGEYRADDANRLIREHLAPLALETLMEGIKRHDVSEVVLTGMEQLARVMDSAIHQQDDLSRVAANLSTEWDPLTRTAELSAETLQLRQCNEIVVEAALRILDASAEAKPITPQAWSGLLAAADAYLTATTLSERMYHQIAPAVINLSPMYELAVDDDSHPDVSAWGLRNDELSRAVASVRLYGTQDDDSLQQTNEGDDVEGAFQQAWGATSQDMLSTLAALAKWETFEPGRTTAHVTVAEATAWVCDALGRGADELQSTRVEAAIGMLTSTAVHMQAVDWKPWQTRTRRHRLLVQPLVQDSDGRLIVSPQYLLTSVQVYYRHLLQGVLPWAGDVPQPVSNALADRRARRNIRFERILQTQLEELGYITIARVKPNDHARLGVPTLTTEVDLVCGRPGDSTIWLIEAKDPASVHGFAETARQLRTFFRDKVGDRGTKPCYTTQLARKENELAPHVASIATRLGLGDPPDGEQFHLSTLFVTRNVTPASYVDERYQVETATEFLAARGRTR
ncbi:hypothetical protein [Microbacterium sp. OVT16B]|uniref:hypothetical protein n=1 Tax=Microbacterium sp. OVT16B TaxID=2862682 RepID=UPI001CC126AF|nr:hypothetical protein [Microbacterium sp. OVT16B]